MNKRPWLTRSRYRCARPPPTSRSPRSSRQIRFRRSGTRTGSSLPPFTSAPKPFDDMGLRRDRVGADHFGAAERHGLCHGLRAFDLLDHVRASSGLASSACASVAAATLRAATSPLNLSLMAWITASSEIIPVSAAKPPSSTAFGNGPVQMFHGNLGGGQSDQMARAAAAPPSRPGPFPPGSCGC